MRRLPLLIDRSPAEDVCAHVPEWANPTDPVLLQLDRLLDDDRLFVQVRADLLRRSRLTALQGRHGTPAEVMLRLLVVKQLSAWSSQETEARVADRLRLSLVHAGVLAPRPGCHSPAARAPRPSRLRRCTT